MKDLTERRKKQEIDAANLKIKCVDSNRKLIIISSQIAIYDFLDKFTMTEERKSRLKKLVNDYKNLLSSNLLEACQRVLNEQVLRQVDSDALWNFILPVFHF